MIRRDFFKTALAAGIAGAGNEAAGAGVSETAATKPRRPRMMFYHDGRHSHIYRYEPPMAPDEYTAMVDELAGTPVDAVMLCLGEGRTMLHDTRARELWGHNVDK